MAYELISHPNTEGASVDNPFGDLIDDPLGVTGTPLNKRTLHDMFVFFQKMMNAAGITPNNQPDNTTHTFQLWTAFKKLVYGAWTNSGMTFTNNVGAANVWGDSPLGGKVHYRLLDNQVFLTGIARNTAVSSPATTEILTLPAGARPSMDTYIYLFSSSPVPQFIKFKVDTTGKLTSLDSCDGDVYLEGASFRIGPDSH